MKKLLLSVLLALPMMANAGSVKSPNGNIELNFSVDATGRPVYEMSYKGRAVVKPSFLGLELAKDKHASKGMDETDLMDGFTIKKEETSTFDETWKPVWGETATIRNHYVEYAAVLQQQSSNRTILIRFRVYDDGIGFRYEFPQQRELNYFLIKEERSEFAMAGDHKAFWLPGDYDTQEQVTQETKLSEIRNRMREAVNWGNSSVAVFSPTGVQTSLQMKSDDGLYINIHEAACADYATMHLELAKDKHASKGMDETDLMDGFTIKKEETSTFDETWKPVWGETATFHNNYVGYVGVFQQQSDNRTMRIGVTD